MSASKGDGAGVVVADRALVTSSSICTIRAAGQGEQQLVARGPHDRQRTFTRHSAARHPEAQTDAPTAAGCERILIDKASGKLARRPELDEALRGLRDGDQLVVTNLDRLGRSLEHLIELSNQLQTRGVDLVVLDQGIDTSTAIGRMFFQILGSIAEFEHALMSERTIDGLAAARARGRTGGQKPKLGPRQARLARDMYEAGELTVAQIAAEFGVTHPTIYRHLDRLDQIDAQQQRPQPQQPD